MIHSMPVTAYQFLSRIKFTFIFHLNKIFQENKFHEIIKLFTIVILNQKSKKMLCNKSFLNRLIQKQLIFK